jgi:enamine deaminase RidA (YjgF/YER057c/UK114 family)
VANYVPCVQSGNLIFVSGQLPVADGERKFIGKVGAEITLAQAQEAARLCALNIVAYVNHHLHGDLSKVIRVVKLGGFVNSAPNFYDHPQVINGASDMMVVIFGDHIGKHSRFAMGASSLPFNVAVEVEAVFQIDS